MPGLTKRQREKAFQLREQRRYRMKTLNETNLKIIRGKIVQVQDETESDPNAQNWSWSGGHSMGSMPPGHGMQWFYLASFTSCYDLPGKIHATIISDCAVFLFALFWGQNRAPISNSKKNFFPNCWLKFPNWKIFILKLKKKKSLKIIKVSTFLDKDKMSRLMTKPTKWHVRPAKAQISLGINPVWSVFAVCMKKAWVLSYPLST